MSREVTAEEILESLNAPLVRCADELGLTPQYLLKKLKSELSARKQREFLTKDGDVVAGRAMPDWDIRQRARQDAHRLLNHYPIERKEIRGGLAIDIGERLSRAISQARGGQIEQKTPQDIVVETARLEDSESIIDEELSEMEHSSK